MPDNSSFRQFRLSSFSAIHLEKTLQEKSLKKLSADHPVFLLYHWPVHTKVLEERGTWEEIGRGAWRRDFGFEWKALTFVSAQRNQ
jgi:diketogulonate reductase-like aldo/keto reductase